MLEVDRWRSASRNIARNCLDSRSGLHVFRLLLLSRNIVISNEINMVILFVTVKGAGLATRKCVCYTKFEIVAASRGLFGSPSSLAVKTE